MRFTQLLVVWAENTRAKGPMGACLPEQRSWHTRFEMQDDKDTIQAARLIALPQKSWVRKNNYIEEKAHLLESY